MGICKPKNLHHSAGVQDRGQSHSFPRILLIWANFANVYCLSTIILSAFWKLLWFLIFFFIFWWKVSEIKDHVIKGLPVNMIMGQFQLMILIMHVELCWQITFIFWRWWAGKSLYALLLFMQGIPMSIWMSIGYMDKLETMTTVDYFPPFLY